MTSTISFKDKIKQGKSMFMWTLKSSKAPIIIYLSLLAFGCICYVVMYFGVLALLSGEADTSELSTVTSFPTMLFTSSVTNIAIIFSYVFAISGFSYLHNKRKADMFGSLPIPRRTQFFSKWAFSIIASAVPMLIICIIMNIAMPINLEALSVLGLEANTFRTTLSAFVAIVANISLFGLLSVCCGKLSDTIVSALVINLAFPIAMFLLQLLPGSLVFGYTPTFNTDIIFALTPLAAADVGSVWYWLIFSAVCVILSYVLIKRRKAECAQSHFAYKLPFVIVKVIVSFAVGISVAYLFLLILGYNKSVFMCYAVFWLGMIIGSFVAHTIIQLVLNHGVKGYVRGLDSYVAMLVVFVALFAVMSTGLAGYESYIPSADEVKSVSFNGEEEAVLNGENILNSSTSDKSVIEKTVQTHKHLIENYEENKGTLFQLSASSVMSWLSNAFYDISEQEGYVYFENSNESLSLTYTLNNGEKITRNYMDILSISEGTDTLFDDEIEGFLNSAEYIENTSWLFICDEDYCKSIEVEDWENDKYKKYSEKQQTEKLLNALRKDIKSDPDATITDSYETDMNISVKYGGKKKYGKVLQTSIDIKESYTNTRKVLEELGYSSNASDASYKVIDA